MIRPARPEALSVRCPWCGASAGEWCSKIMTRRRGKQPVSLFVHPSRSDAVSPVAAPVLPRLPWGPLDPNPQF